MKLLIVFAASLVWAATASATPVSTCQVADFMDDMGNADSCHIGASANDSEADVNALGIGTFALLGKSDDDPDIVMVTEKDPGPGFNWTVVPGLNSTTLFVVKQASWQSANPGGWIGYLFVEPPTSPGMFFTEYSFDVNDYSHLSVYTQIEPGSPIPEPSMALLLGIGLVGLSAQRGRA